MNCSRVRDLLPDYAVELLDAGTHRGVAEHLKICADCRAELQAQDAAVALVEQYGRLEPPVGLFNAVRNQIESGAVVRERAPWWAWLYTRPARGLAMGLAMASVALGLFLPVGPQASIGELPMHMPVAGQGMVARGELANSIRQHAMAAAEGPLTDRVAWEAMAQLAAQKNDETGRPVGEAVRTR